MRKLFLFSFLILGIGCTNAQPQIALSETPQISLNQSVFASTDPNTYTVTLTGTCPRYVTEIQISVDGGATWQNASSLGAATLNCETAGTYSVVLNNIGTLVPAIGALSSGNSESFQVRGLSSEFGTSANLTVSVSKIAIGYKILAKFSGVTKGSGQVVASGHTSESLKPYRDLASGHKIRGGLKQ